MKGDTIMEQPRKKLKKLKDPFLNEEEWKQEEEEDDEMMFIEEADEE